ncbi:pilus assembly protein N-terminal domain-containing protein [Shewanella sp. D64]|uniref:type II and III secretion system protein family protein n=1 Tax=unclassified Shewanella TaxID=196818 RepID=UPI0022BA6518|nr:MULTISPECIES: pilus assembly protein N-terminal domain-containing protein [unclassified Shewanella]MEC4728089.1 pilus assembly protein N-terminal domain-containing protein [Shewanella sp. D64]MEC4738153.1 pilus assembly protein N-terminal domain-containing protein [Shewanella sp. E94]WBJ96335.1 pilus assembly protein N-terminal domain-containing protein [Shewanella sp. MTB7]
MKNNKIIRIIWIALLIPFLSFAHNNKPMKLYVGAVELYKAKDVERIVVGNSKVISAKVIDNKGVLLIGEGNGNTDLQLWQKNGKLIKLSITVTNDNSLRTSDKVKKMLAAFPSITVTESDGLIIVQGEADLALKQQLESIIGEAPNVVSLVNYLKFAKTMSPMIKMQVKIVEFNKSTLNNVGIKWETAMSGPAYGAAKAFTSNPLFNVASPGQYAEAIGGAITDGIGVLDTRGWSYFGIVTGIGSQIQLLSEKGDARMLAEPNLTTRSGESASFLSGGEFPIRSISGLGSVDVEFKEYGIKLDIEPVVDGNNNIISRVMAEVSSIDPSVAIDGIPGTLTRRTESVINVKNNETIVISGLVNSEMSKVVNKFPFLGDIPILGELFKSRDFKDNKTELVIFVTPTIVFPGEESHDKHLARGLEMAEETNKLEAFYILD